VFHRSVQLQQVRQAAGNGLDAHPLAHGSPEEKQMLLLLRAEPTPAITAQPADRFGHEGGENVKEVVVADRVMAMDAVQPCDHRPAGFAVDAVSQ